MNQSFPTLKRTGNSGPAGSPTLNGVAIPAWDATPQNDGQFLQAALFGAAAALLGCILYAAFTIATGLNIGIVAALVGYMVGWAVLQGSGGVGGQTYQILAVVLTYFSVSLASIPEILWHWSSRGVALTPDKIVFLFEYGLASPILDLQYGVGYGVISLIILFYAVRRAWRMTRARPFKA